MGVHGLWDLLAPVGRRVSVETLAGKRLAIDASIWMIQFMKAMRDEKGEMVRNAHLLGFFRRICKLLFLRTKPVFVFDGGTPALKRRTVVARRRQRENAQAKIRKTAEKLLMNHVKAMRLKKLADDLKDQKANNSKGKEVMSDQSDTLDKNGAAVKKQNQEMIDEMLAATILAEESGGLDGSASTSSATTGGYIRNASASASAAAFLTEDEDDEDDEEMIMPVTDGNVDPAVLAALPPSMQLDLLVQMRERLMAENRQKYQKVKKAPQKFSELQIEAYLKTVAFRREIDQVQKTAAGKGVAGVQTSRIASETNREFIFSSSFSGDKQLLASGGAEKNPGKQQTTGKKDSSLDILNIIASASKSNPGVGPTADEPVGNFGDDVQTFLDERGRTRVSRRRAMGIRMTRDLERNIEIMKELEQERTSANDTSSGLVKLDEEKSPSEKSHSEGQFCEALDELNSDAIQNMTENSSLEAMAPKDELAAKSETCIKISFNDDKENRSLDGDDELFAHLVAGNPVVFDSNSASDCEWEEGFTGRESGSLINENKLEGNHPHEDAANNDDSDLEWEEGTQLIIDNKLEINSFDTEDRNNNDTGAEWRGQSAFNHEPEFSADAPKFVSKGSAEEEAAIQEAIRRSLEELRDETTSKISRELDTSDSACKASLCKSCCPEPNSQLGSGLHDNGLSQSFSAESGGSILLSGEGVYAPNVPGMNLRSAAAGTAVVRAQPFAPSGATKNLCQQQPDASKDNAQIADFANNGLSEPNQVAGSGALIDSLHPTIVEDITNDGEAARICNSSNEFGIPIAEAASTAEEQILHTNVKGKMAEEDTYTIDVQERGDDVAVSASKDEDDTIGLVGSRLEDELLVLDQEYKNLGDEQRKLERNADSVSAEMFVECQELLQMFGLPYIIAPMEAEAQCAYMELINLVDGVVTDDSDVFLFGAGSVYKNIFDDRKYVETYFMKDIESELGLNREKLIRMAMLLGSDYTEGVSGIGIVNAIEVVNAFPEEDGLHKFRQWVESPDPTILGKVGLQPGSSSKKKGSKASKNGMADSKSYREGTSTSDSKALEEDEDNQAMKQIFMDKHRNISKNWHIPASFPSDAVVSAYTAPQVDKSTEPFAWGKPDIFSLRRLCWEKFAWASQKADELLLPVLKEYNKHETQLRLEAFYTFNERFAKIRSKRIKQAVKGITGKQSLELANTDNLKDLPENMGGSKASTSGDRCKKEKPHTKRKDSIVGQRSISAKKSKSQQKRKDPKEGLSSEGGSMGLCTEAEERRLSDPGGSRVRGRQKGKAVGKVRRKEKIDSELHESSTPSSNSDNDAHEHLVPLESREVSDTLRRSKRQRKAPNYVENDEESDQSADSLNRSNHKSCNYKAAEQESATCQYLPSDNVNDSGMEGILTPEDPLLGDGFSGDYLTKGGGFCDDEEKTEMEINRVEADEQYLQMGGGFCVDEAEEAAGDATDQHESAVSLESALDSVQSLGRTSPVSDFKLNPGDLSQRETANENLSNVVDVEGGAPTTVNAFSAIPFLKRKRRKT